MVQLLPEIKVVGKLRVLGIFCGRVDGKPVSIKGIGLMLKICFCFIPEVVFSISVKKNTKLLCSVVCNSIG